MSRFRISSACFLVFILATTWLFPSCFAVSREEALQLISQADESLVSAYLAVAKAKAVGANVSLLESRLNVAGELLAEANNSFRIDDYGSAYAFAVQCNQSLSAVVEDASSLKIEVETDYMNRLYFTGAISSVILSVLFVVSLFLWRFLKRQYLKRLMKMKPVEIENR